MDKEQQILTYMKNLQITREEAEELWLCDNDLAENEEQSELQDKASKVKIDHQACGNIGKVDRKPRTCKVSDEKTALFSEILSDLEDVYKENVEILKENKLIQVKIGAKTFKIDIIETRPPKK